MDTKEEVLKKAGYRYNLDRMSYVNRVAKKIFSIEAVEDHPEDWLAERIAEHNDTGQWKFYFNEAPPPSVVRDIVAELDGQRAVS